MNYSEKINLQLKEQGLKKDWLADKLGLRYVEFWKKMKRNLFTKEEKKDVQILLGEPSINRDRIIVKANMRKKLKELAKII